jgi:hypothetical protein
MTRWKALALAALLSAAGPCFAADPAGDWIGTLHAHNDEQTRLGIEVRRGPHGLTATYEDMTHDYRSLQMTPIGTAAAPAFKITSLIGVYTARWDPQAGAWTGVWRESRGAYPMSLARGAIPPAPAITGRDRITLWITAGLIVLEGVAIARLVQLRRRRRLKALPAPA